MYLLHTVREEGVDVREEGSDVRSDGVRHISPACFTQCGRKEVMCGEME